VSVKTHKRAEQHCGNQNSMASFVARVWAGQFAVQFIVGEKRTFIFSKTFRLALGSALPPIQWVPNIHSPSIGFSV